MGRRMNAKCARYASAMPSSKNNFFIGGITGLSLKRSATCWLGDTPTGFQAVRALATTTEPWKGHPHRNLLAKCQSYRKTANVKPQPDERRNCVVVRPQAVQDLAAD